MLNPSRQYLTYVEIKITTVTSRGACSVAVFSLVEVYIVTSYKKARHQQATGKTD